MNYLALIIKIILVFNLLTRSLSSYIILEKENINPKNINCGGFGVYPLVSSDNLDIEDNFILDDFGKFLALDQTDSEEWKSEIFNQFSEYVILPNTTFVQPGHVLRICRKRYQCVNIYSNNTAIPYNIEDVEYEEFADFESTLDLHFSEIVYATCYEVTLREDDNGHIHSYLIILKWITQLELLQSCENYELRSDECMRVYAESGCGFNKQPFLPLFKSYFLWNKNYTKEQFFSYKFNPNCSLTLNSIARNNIFNQNLTWKVNLTKFSQETKQGQFWFDGQSTNIMDSEFKLIFKDFFNSSQSDIFTGYPIFADMKCDCDEEDENKMSSEPAAIAPLKEPKLSKDSKGIIISCSVLIIVIIIGTISGIYIQKCRRSNQLQVNLEIPEDLILHLDIELPKKAFSIDEKKFLGAGESGLVFMGKINSGDVDVAIKMCKKPISLQSAKSILNEIKVMHFVGKHPNIVCLLGACTKKAHRGEIFSILELCAKGSLKEYLQQMSKTLNRNIIAPQIPINGYANPINLQQNPPDDLQTQNKFIKWCKEILSAMQFLGDKNVIHIDLAARNVLLTEDLTAKLADFGLSRKLDSILEYKKTSNDFVPWKWLSLESIQTGTFSIKSDVWSFGVIWWEIFNLCVSEPYPQITCQLKLISDLNSGKTLSCPTYSNKQMFLTMKKCWDKDPAQRPDFASLEIYFSNMYRPDVIT